jgi:hypothetical protein
VDTWLSKETRPGNQFLDFINRLDQKYDDNIKQIFLVLDNAFIQIKQGKTNDSKMPSKNTSSISTD